MERKQIQFTRRQTNAIQREAKRRKMSEAAVVRDAVDAWMAKRGEPPKDDRVARALAVVGRFSSGLTDVAREHDREFADSIGP